MFSASVVFHSRWVCVLQEVPCVYYRVVFEVQVGRQGGEMLIKVDNNVSDATAYLVLRRQKCRVMKMAVHM